MAFCSSPRACAALRFAIAAAAALLPSGAAEMHFDYSGFPAISVFSPPRYVTTMITTEDESIPQQWRYYLTTDYPLCLDTITGCLVGSFVFQPPALNLPPGAQIIAAAMFWNVSYTLTHIQTITVTPKGPGYYRASQVPEYTGNAFVRVTTPGGPSEYVTGFGSGGAAGDAYYTEAVRAAVAAGTPLPPVLADLYLTYYACGSQYNCGSAGENSLTVDSHVLTVTATGGAYNFQIYYEAVPEPRPMLLIGAGTLFLFGFRTFRGVSSGEKK
jgi:hypothetical protein